MVSGIIPLGWSAGTYLADPQRGEYGTNNAWLRVSTCVPHGVNAINSTLHGRRRTALGFDNACHVRRYGAHHTKPKRLRNVDHSPATGPLTDDTVANC